MKNIRERLGKSLMVRVETGKKSAVRPEPGSPTTMGEKAKTIQNMTEAEFAKRYKLQGQVMESTNTGMQVLFATRLVDKIQVVIKVRERSKSFKVASDEQMWRATTEMQMNMPQCDTLCQFIEVIATKQNYYVVMEKVEGQDLFEQMAEKKLNESESQEVVYQILEALQTMHAKGRIHKDLKLENVMVDMDSPKMPSSPGRKSRLSQGSQPNTPSSPGVKLIDFDTVETYEPSSPTTARDVLGTDGYIAPEAYLGSYSPASDIYCVGVIMYKLLTRKFPTPSGTFDDEPGENWVGSPAMKRIYDRLKEQQISFERPPLDKNLVAADLCRNMLSFNAEDRPTAEQALKHDWFRKEL